jgi:hypothetical protein
VAIVLRRNSFVHFPAFYNRLLSFVLGLASLTARRRQHRTWDPDTHAAVLVATCSYSSQDCGHIQHPPPPPPPHSVKSVTAPMSEPWRGGPPPSRGLLRVWQSGPRAVEGEGRRSGAGESRTPLTPLSRPSTVGEPRQLPESILVASLSPPSSSSTLLGPLLITRTPSERAVKMTLLPSPSKDELFGTLV